MVCPFGQSFTKLIGEGLLVCAVGAHLVGLVNNDEVPLAAEEALVGILNPRHPGYRGDDLVLLLPGVRAVIRTKNIAANDLEVLAELILQLALPLEGKTSRRDDKRALDEAADLEFLDQEPRHNCLAGAGVVCQEKTNPWELEKMVVDSFELVRKCVYAGNRQGKVGIVFVC